MRVSMKWLKELVPVDLAVDDLVDRLDMTGTAVEAVHTAGQAMENVVVGLIAEKVRHPEADKLWVTTIDVGDGRNRTIVCGAQNFEAGDKVPVALPGAVLPGGFEIKKAKLRGVVSEGMNCSAKELGIGQDHDGLLILDKDAPIGMPFAEYSGLSDTVLELEVTPNRPDCLSVAGIAREVGAVLGAPATVPSSSPVESDEPADATCAIEIADPDLCPRYSARIIRGVKIGQSPDWLAQKVTAAGARPINNIVDITNYVMFELGQPLHAFDLTKLARDDDGLVRIVVRTAQKGERLTTLDGVERALSPEDLLITDASGPIALAGVMGGETTEVSETTVDVLLESACFRASAISRTSRSLGLVSEASLRFERVVDRTSTVAAADRAASLMAELAGGTVERGVVDAYPDPYSEKLLLLRKHRLAQILGARIPDHEVAGILGRLGCEVRDNDEVFEVIPPSFRPDLEREIDLVEEVLRIWGMDRIEATLPGSGRAGGLTPEQIWRERIGATLRAAGLNETMTYSFGDPDDLTRCDMALGADELLVSLLNPMSGEQAVLRRSMLPGLLRSVSSNQRRGVENVHLYEMGKTFVTAQGRKQPKERDFTMGVLAGAWNDPSWNAASVPIDFFDGKGVIETLVRELGIQKLKVRQADIPWLQPGRSAEVLIAGEVVGWVGEVHPLVLDRFEAVGPVVALELETARLIRAATDVKPFIEPPRFPAIELDVAIVVPEDVTAERLEQSVQAAGGKLLESSRLFDVYRGPGVPQGKKSMALRLVYRASDKTLTADEVDAAHGKLLRKVTGALGGELRG